MRDKKKKKGTKVIVRKYKSKKPKHGSKRGDAIRASIKRRKLVQFREAAELKRQKGGEQQEWELLLDDSYYNEQVKIMQQRKEKLQQDKQQVFVDLKSLLAAQKSIGSPVPLRSPVTSAPVGSSPKNDKLSSRDRRDSYDSASASRSSRK